MFPPFAVGPGTRTARPGISFSSPCSSEGKLWLSVCALGQIGEIILTAGRYVRVLCLQNLQFYL